MSAQGTEGGLEGWLRMGMENYDNLFSQETDTDSDWAQVKTLGAEFTSNPSDALEVFFNAEVELKSFNEFSDEDSTDLELGAGVERRLDSDSSVSAEFGYDRNWVGAGAYGAYDTRQWELSADYSRKLSPDGHKLKIGGHVGRMTYNDYSEYSYEDRAVRAELSIPLRGLASASLAYEISEDEYPDSEILDSHYNITDKDRVDEKNKFTASVSNIFSIYPLSYGQVSVSVSESDSNSTELDYNTGRIIMGYDEKNTRSAALFAIREFGSGNSLAFYLYYHELEYPNRAALAPDYSNRGYNREDDMLYLYVRYIHSTGSNSDLGIEYTFIDNDSNSSGSGYKQGTLSLYLETRFK